MTLFRDTALNEEILKALDELGFENMTPIQEKAIPHLLTSDRDLIALAQTGTGKTAAFSLPVINRLDPSSAHIQALILCPTRELCLQIKRDIEVFIKHIKGLKVEAIYGGDSIGRQLSALERGPQIVVATPGRANDFINRKKLKVNMLSFLVLDEADEMLNMGFKEELDAILETTPDDKQTLLFSATMARNVKGIANQYMKNPEQIQAAGTEQGTDSVTHQYYVIHARDRYEALARIIDSNPDIYGVIFCRTRVETQDVADRLMQAHYSAEPLHGDIAQNQREKVMDRFRRKKTQLLVATDVAARGIDVNELTHVINYQLPDQMEAYIHRSGRTGRAHSKGVSISLVHMKEQHFIKALERKLERKFERLQVPTGMEVCASQMVALVDKITEVEVDEKKIEKFLPVLEEKLKDFDREELLKRFISLEFNRILESYTNAADLNVQVSDQGARLNRNGFSKGDFANVAFSLGRRDGFDKKILFGLINREEKLKGVEIGNIQVGDIKTVFEIDKKFAAVAVKFFNDINMKGRQVKSWVEEGGVIGGGRSFGGGRSGGNGGRKPFAGKPRRKRY